jgi:hypothetical protein
MMQSIHDSAHQLEAELNSIAANNSSPARAQLLQPGHDQSTTPNGVNNNSNTKGLADDFLLVNPSPSPPPQHLSSTNNPTTTNSNPSM